MKNEDAIKRMEHFEMNKIMDKLKLNTKKPNWLEYLFPIMLWAVWIFLYSYIDFRSLTIWSTTLLDCLIDGNLYDYYQIVHENIYGVPHAYFCYNYIILIPWAIWNIPIWLIQRFLHVEILSNTWMMAWSHLFLVVVFCITLIYAKKIVEMFVEDKTQQAWNSYLILTFPFMFLGIVMAGQTDIIAIAITVIAIYYLLKDKQGIFLVLMAVSIAAKPFFIFAYIAIILLIEKNIIKIGLKLACSTVFMLLFQVIYQNAPMYLESYAAGTGNSIIEKTVASTIDANINYDAPWVIILLVILYVVAYFIPYNTSNEKKYYVIYMMVAPMMVYFCFAHYEFYRMIYLAPFLLILITINQKLYRINVILEMVFSIVGVFLMIYYKWTAGVTYFNHNLMNALGWNRSTSECTYASLYDLLTAKMENLPMIQNMAAAVFITVAGIVLVINLPMVTARIKQPVEKCERWLYWLNTIVMYGFTGILLMCYLNMVP